MSAPPENKRSKRHRLILITTACLCFGFFAAGMVRFLRLEDGARGLEQRQADDALAMMASGMGFLSVICLAVALFAGFIFKPKGGEYREPALSIIMKLMVLGFVLLIVLHGFGLAAVSFFLNRYGI